MNLKKPGYITIESIISMTIISIGMYLISICIYNSYSIINLNEQKFEMLNIAKKEIEKHKYYIKHNETKVVGNSYYNTKKNNYTIETTIKEEVNYQCYEVSVEVYNEKYSINLDGYAFKQ